MVSRLLAAALPDSSTSAKGARCFCTSGNTGAGAAPMSGSVMGRRLDGRRLAAGAPASAATAGGGFAGRRIPPDCLLPPHARPRRGQPRRAPGELRMRRPLRQLRDSPAKTPARPPKAGRGAFRCAGRRCRGEAWPACCRRAVQSARLRAQPGGRNPKRAHPQGNRRPARRTLQRRRERPAPAAAAPFRPLPKSRFPQRLRRGLRAAPSPPSFP